MLPPNAPFQASTSEYLYEPRIETLLLCVGNYSWQFPWKSKSGIKQITKSTIFLNGMSSSKADVGLLFLIVKLTCRALEDLPKFNGLYFDIPGSQADYGNHRQPNFGW